MAREKNDGKGRLGGRSKGTPNKATADIKQWVASILEDGRDKFMQSMEMLEPSEYVRVFSGLLNYVVPKQQAISMEAKLEAEIKQLERLLDDAPDEAIEKIANRIISIQTQMKDEKQ